MNKKELVIAQKVIRLLQRNWMLCDDNDAYDYLTLVDSNRAIHELKPTKELITKMQKEDLINSKDKFDKREFMKLLGIKHPIPFIYHFIITEKDIKL